MQNIDLITEGLRHRFVPTPYARDSYDAGSELDRISAAMKSQRQYIEDMNRSLREVISLVHDAKNVIVYQQFVLNALFGGNKEREALVEYLKKENATQIGTFEILGKIDAVKFGNKNPEQVYK